LSYRLECLSPGFGARVTGIDLRAPVDADTAARLNGDLIEHRVLVLPGQELDHASHVRFSRHFGPLDVYPVARYVVPEHPEVLRISNIFENGEPIGLYDGDEQEEWHTDCSWKPVMSRASLLYSAIAPAKGGDTVFADATAAYDDLSAAAKTRIDGLRAVHSMAHLVEQERAANPHKKRLSAEERARMPDVAQPVVRTHPLTGRRSLLLGSMIISGVEGMDPTRSRALLDELLAHATADRYLYRHHWSVGDLVIWDNDATMHTRTACDSTRHYRLLYRTTVMPASRAVWPAAVWPHPSGDARRPDPGRWQDRADAYLAGLPAPGRVPMSRCGEGWSVDRLGDLPDVPRRVGEGGGAAAPRPVDRTVEQRDAVLL
jgi:taurine dioxygenase